MLGFWNRAVYITYLGAFLAVFGLLMYFKIGNVDYAFLGMILAAVCDMFDGKVARSTKNRSEQEKDFGVQIDSLADIVAFIVVPALTIYRIGLTNVYQLILLSLYVVAGIVRLAYFNVCMSNKNEAIKSYQGLPVPAAIIIYTSVWLLAKIIPFVLENEVLIYTILVPIVGYLHISKIKIKKYTGNWFYITICLLALIALILGLFVL